jgi:hypothetical protein
MGKMDICTTAALLTSAVAGAAPTGRTTAPPAVSRDLEVVVAAVRHAGGPGRAVAEMATGTRLEVVETSAYFTTFRGVGRDGSAVEVRTPLADSGATAGPLMVYEPKGGCMAIDVLRRRYGPWQLAEVPHGHSRSERTVWTRDEAWGRMSFGFAEDAPACLADITFEGAHGGADGRMP